MNGSPSSIIMLGLGNGTFAGSASLCVTLGFGVGAAAPPVIPTVFPPLRGLLNATVPLRGLINSQVPLRGAP